MGVEIAECQRGSPRTGVLAYAQVPARPFKVAAIAYDDWYPEVPPVMNTKELGEHLHTNEQIIRAWAREGIIPAHRVTGARKFTFLRHEIFDWLIDNRYGPGA